MCLFCVQVAGVRVFHSAGTFNSVVFLEPDGNTVPINPTSKYTIVSTDYTLSGGDGFSMFEDAEVLLPAGLPYAEQVIEDLKLFPKGVSALRNVLSGCAETCAVLHAGWQAWTFLFAATRQVVALNLHCTPLSFVHAHVSVLALSVCTDVVLLLLPLSLSLLLLLPLLCLCADCPRDRKPHH